MDSSINLIFAANPVNCEDIKLTGNKAFGYVNLIWETNDNLFFMINFHLHGEFLSNQVK